MRTFLIAFALASTGAATASPPAALTTQPVQAARATLPALAVPAADWERYFAKADASESMEAYGVLARIYDGKATPGAECGKLLPELDAAIVRVPVGIALWRAGELCAQAMHDSGLENRYADGVGKLAAHALSRSGAGPDAKPIVVLNGDDIKAIVDATGLRALYGYGEWKPHSPYLRLTYALFDADRGIERHLGFDYLDTFYRTTRKDKFSGYPSERMALRNSLLAAMPKSGDFSARDLGIADGSREKTSPEQLAMLRETAAKGGLVAADFWWSICAGKEPACADGLVDALLPQAEQGLAMYRIQLALAYLQGVGVEKDPKAALTLLDAAEKRWPGHAYARLAEQLIDNGTPVPAAVVERLDRAARGGSRRAMEAWAKSRVLELGDADEMPPPLLARMLELGGKDIPTAIAALASHFNSKGDRLQAREWYRRGAATGDAELMGRFAIAQFYGNPGPRESAAGIESMRAAASAGNAFAMYWMGGLAGQRKQWAEAEAWYASAIDYGKNDAIVPLLEMYSNPHPGISPTPEEVRGKYRKIEGTAYDDARFRRSYAFYLGEKATPRDPARARQLLLVDAEKDDVESQVMLGRALLTGSFGEKDAKAGMSWLERAASKKPEGKDSLANYLYYGQRDLQARKRALDIERELVKADYDPARNNLAWWLCTSEDESLRAPEEGLRAALAMGTADEIEAPALDTVAACYAATGDFADAEATQEIVVQRSDLLPMSDDDRELRERLELFRNRKAYIETRKDEPAM